MIWDSGHWNQYKQKLVFSVQVLVGLKESKDSTWLLLDCRPSPWMDAETAFPSYSVLPWGLSVRFKTGFSCFLLFCRFGFRRKSTGSCTWGICRTKSQLKRCTISSENTGLFVKSECKCDAWNYLSSALHQIVHFRDTIFSFGILCCLNDVCIACSNNASNLAVGTHSWNCTSISRGNTPETKGTAFVVYEDIFDAKNACDHLSGFNVCNRYLVVLYYQSNKVSFLTLVQINWAIF